MQSPLTLPQQRVLSWIEDFIAERGIPPVVREIQEGLGYQSPTPVMNHLKTLMHKGYITYELRKSRSIQILKPSRTIPILGTIAAHSLITVFPDAEVQWIDLSRLPQLASLSRHELGQHYALRVRGDSMVDALIADGDVVVLRPAPNPAEIKDGTIVAARVNEATTLKYFYRNGNLITLKPANSRYSENILDAAEEEVQIQGVFVGVLRGLA